MWWLKKKIRIWPILTFILYLTFIANTSFKSLYKQVSEHKDVLKMVSMLSSIISSSKIEATKVLEQFKDFKKLWEEVYAIISNV